MSDSNHHLDPAAAELLALPVPPGWARTTVSELGEVRLGRQRSPKNRSSENPTKYIRAANITWTGLDLSEVLDMEFRPEEMRAYRLEPGDVLLSEASGSSDEVGKPVIWNGEIEDCCFQNTVVRFRPHSVSSKFACLAFLHYARNGVFSRVAKGVGIQHLSADRFSALPLLLPPEAEQGRIVAKVEELFSELDAGVVAIKRVQANLKRYRSAVLRAAVEGRLTEAWRAENRPSETGDQLLERILKERRRRWEEVQRAAFASTEKDPPKNWQSKYKEPSSPDTTLLPALPDGWCWASVEQLGDVQLGRQRSPDNRSKDHPTKYIRAANLTENGLVLDDVLDMEFTPSERESYLLKLGDILLSEASGSPDQVGKPVVWHGELEGCCFQNTVIRLRPTIISSEYLLTVFQHLYFNKVFAQIAAGVGINHLSAGKFSRVAVPVPPQDEQQVIVQLVEQCIRGVQDSRRWTETVEKRASRLRQSILQQAFEGKLVAQDPADEPASVLLARIQQHRAKSTASSTAPASKPGRLPREVFLRRSSIVSYTVRRLAAHRSFGRTQLEKTVHLTQTHLGVDLGFVFERYAAGPFDKDIYKLEGVARKNDWFTTQKRPKFGVTYHPGSKIDQMCERATGYLGDRRADLDRLLDHIAGMNTDEAELFATAYAAWNDLLIDGRPADDDAIITEVHGWHEQKKRFGPEAIRTRLEWMRKNGYVPTGQGQRTRLAGKETKLPSRRRKKGDAST